MNAIAATCVDLEPTILSQRKTNIWYHLYVKPKGDTDGLIYKTDLELQKQKTNLLSPGVRWVGRGERKLEDWDCHIRTTIYIKQITYLLYSTVNSTQYSVMAYMGKESKKEYVYI